MTVAGDIKLVRTYLDCQACQQSGYPLDERLGINGRYSPRVQRLICLAAASWSYDLSSDRLEEFCGLSVSDTTIRSLAQQHGASALRWLRECPEGVKDFREARGEIEFTTDGTCVNTIEGWREMKLGIFSKRERGTPAQISEWDSRSLPVAEPRIAFAAIETSEEFGRRWKAWQKRLGIVDSSAVTVLADGAKWIWEEQRKHLVYAEGVLDIFHVLERVHETGKELHAEGSQVQAWTDQVRELLLSGGFVAVRGFLSDCQAAANGAGAQAIERLWGYLAAHGGHLNYAERLQTGRSIGSGQVEGACKNMIGRRLKANSARWRVRRVNRMAGLCSLMYSQQWETYWLAA